MEGQPHSEDAVKSYRQYISEQNEATINDFVQFASSKLGLRNPPNVEVVPTRQEGMTTASYSPSDSTIRVVGGNRATFDVCRSIAHELVHQYQHQNGDELDGETGSPCEDEANALAGRLIRMYGADNEKFYEE